MLWAQNGVFMVIALVRTVILYFVIVGGIRLMGKRQIGELEPTELVVALLIADLASVPMQDYGIPLLFGIIPIITLLCLTMAVSVLTVRSVRFRSIFCGRPSIIIEKGAIVQREMMKNRLTIDELMEELRLNGVTDLTTIHYGILETNGQLSLLPYAKEIPVTAEQMGKTPKDAGLPLVIINDGQLFQKNLAKRGLDTIWLHDQLAMRNLSHHSQVYLFTVDEGQGVYCLPKEEGTP